MSAMTCLPTLICVLVLGYIVGYAQGRRDGGTR